ncbi:hypothetical protein ASZ90_008283 [hydrocarbon metagenome]|uniref:Uncharacterized protein n=1 Tax=hydrocarbon metagenome TaxID=938273 RepID=A0A0W8FMB3_9ZZZZ
MRVKKTNTTVIPAKAGIQEEIKLDAGLRRHDIDCHGGILFPLP